ncbi:MAG: prephenate dehydrogenase/arogenate dehydrogenase family protein [Alphaproteobacteria bacterium]|nr:prephenate dehydrogenase/arogenate dehydrogenase family protein [Alphaproteobacteria bacterium]
MVEDIKKITIVGGGQVGTSLVMAVRRQYPHAAIAVIEQDARLKNDFARALNRAGVDGSGITFTTTPDAVTDSDLTILATPISQFGNAIKSLRAYLSPSTIITDVGSVKEASIRNINAALQEAGLQNAYVPAHPLNGNAGSGPLSASPDSREGATLFQGKPVALIPGANPQAHNFVAGFWRSLGADVHEMAADAHDRTLGVTSHLQHALMFALIQTDFFKDGEGADIGGWVHGQRGMTRIADAGTEMWRAIFTENRANILRSAESFKHTLRQIAKIAEDETSLWRTVGRWLGFNKLKGIIDVAHSYARQVLGDRGGNPLRASLYSGAHEDLAGSAFASLISTAIAMNARHTETITGQPIAPIANPSLKDGMAPIGIDPGAVQALLAQYGTQLPAMVSQYIEKLDILIDAIKRNDNKAICRFIDTARETRKAILMKPSYPETKPQFSADTALKS